MSKICFYLSIILVLSTLGCQNNESNEKSTKRVEEIRLGRELSPSEIIRNPMGEQGLDTSKVAKITFEETNISFGSIKEGEMVEKSFQFSNSGKFPLYILDVYGTCGCTVPEWPKGMIEPGRGGSIKVKFNSEGKTNEQRKLITVVANTFPVETLLYLDGIVTSKN
jgi:hypothetical protein